MQASLRLHKNLGFEQAAEFRQVGKKFGRWLDLVCAAFRRRLSVPLASRDNSGSCSILTALLIEVAAGTPRFSGVGLIPRQPPPRSPACKNFCPSFTQPPCPHEISSHCGTTPRGWRERRR